MAQATSTRLGKHDADSVLIESLSTLDPDAVELLTAINLDDLFKAFGLMQLRHSPLWHVFHPAARRLAVQVLTFDALITEIGLQASGAWLLGQVARDVWLSGTACIPATGPALIVANHPGLYDTIALFAAIARPDLRVIAADRPFLQALPNINRFLLTIDEQANGRMGVVRAAARHLRLGGCVLLFPGGKIEPDPASMPGAITALREWSASVDLFGRLVPQLAVVPAVVSGVLSTAALNHPIAKLKRRPAERDLLAATLQMLFPLLQRQPVRVEIGRPLQAEAYASTDGSLALGTAVLAATAQLMEHVQ